jgi:crossover junction endodeoxyribonuclease RusA
VNGLYANRKRGRQKTEKYRAWIEAAGWMIRAAPDRHNRHTGPVKLTILVRKPDGRRRDVSNLVKAIEDLLVLHQIMFDDSQVQRVNVEWSQEVAHGAKVVIEDLVNSPQP